MLMISSKQRDVLALLIFPAASFALTTFFDLSFFVSTVLFFGVPSLYLSIGCRKNNLKRYLLWSLLFTIPISLFLDHIAAITGAWFIPHSLFAFRAFGEATIEVWLFTLLWGLYALLFYERFFPEARERQGYTKRFKVMLGIFAALLAYSVIGYVAYPAILDIPYFYLVLSLIFVLPPLTVYLVKHPERLPSFALTALYFCYATFLFEIAALKRGHWSFPGEFIATINMLGVEFPVEEFVFWMILATPAYLAYYGYFGKGSNRTT